MDFNNIFTIVSSQNNSHPPPPTTALREKLGAAGVEEGMRDTVVLGFFFLRFLCPGILSPVENRVRNNN